MLRKTLRYLEDPDPVFGSNKVSRSTAICGLTDGRHTTIMERVFYQYASLESPTIQTVLEGGCGYVDVAELVVAGSAGVRKREPTVGHSNQCRSVYPLARGSWRSIHD